MSLSELIAQLSDLKAKRGDVPVFGSWEGQTNEEIDVYFSKFGTVLIDCDGSMYRKDYDAGVG